MKAQFQKVSLIDYPGKISSVIFFGKCNYQCPTCHAKQIIHGKKEISEKEFLDYLDSRKGLIDAVVLCGGEPTAETDLKNFIRKIKEKNLFVKLDTNGSNPEVLADLVKEKLIDYVAMDVKGPPELYSNLIGREFNTIRNDFEKSLDLIQKAKGYELRTTIVPVFENGNFRWMTKEEIRKMAEWIKPMILDSSNTKWHIQRFVAREKEDMLDEKFSKENLPKEHMETPIKVMEEVKEEMRKYFPVCEIR